MLTFVPGFSDLGSTIADRGTEFALPVLTVSALILLGVLVGWLVKQAIINVLNFLRIRRFTEATGLDKIFSVRISWAALLGDIAEWTIIFVFLLWALSIFPATAGVQDLVKDLVNYLPQVMGAIVVVLVGAVVADLLSRFVENTAKVIGASTAVFLADVAKYAVLITVFLTALIQLGVRQEFLTTLYSALVWGLAGAFILSFGLGGQDAARDVISRARANWPKGKKR